VSYVEALAPPLLDMVSTVSDRFRSAIVAVSPEAMACIVLAGDAPVAMRAETGAIPKIRAVCTLANCCSSGACDRMLATARFELVGMR